MKKQILVLAALATVVSAFISPVFGMLAAGIVVMALSLLALHSIAESLKIAADPIPVW